MFRQVLVVVTILCACEIVASQDILDGKQGFAETFDVFAGKARCFPCRLPAGGAADLEISVTGRGVNLYVFDETNFINYLKNGSREAAVAKEGTVKCNFTSPMLNRGNWYIVVKSSIDTNGESDMVGELIFTGVLALVGIPPVIKTMINATSKKDNKNKPEQIDTISRVELKGTWKFNIAKTEKAISEKKVVTDLSKSFQVEAGKTLNNWIEIPSSTVPGDLNGSWVSTGKSAGIKGANDDSLVNFQLLDVEGKVIQKIDHPVSGTIKYRVTVPGKYTMIFSNAGFVRSSARNVELKATYTPD